jgi:hypothetical protein
MARSFWGGERAAPVSSSRAAYHARGRRPGIWPVRDRGVSRNPRHPGSLRRRVSKHVAIPRGSRRSPRPPELVEAYAHCADRRDTKGQMALFTMHTHFAVYMNSKDPKPSQELHSRQALAPVFVELNEYDATTHFLGQSTIRNPRNLLPCASRDGRRWKTPFDGHLPPLSRHLREDRRRLVVC